MKNHTRILFFVVTAALTGASQLAAATTFVRPGAWYLDYGVDGMSAKIAPSVAVGARFGTNDTHEVSLDVAYANWDYERSLFATVSLGQFGDGKLVPVLASYRYYFGLPTHGIHVFIGGSAGLAYVKGDLRQDGSGLSWRASYGDTSLAYSGMAGVSGEFNERVGYELGYRYLYVNDRSSVSTNMFAGSGGYVAGGPTVKSPRMEAHVLTAAVNIRF
jgi:hypothetical protein